MNPNLLHNLLILARAGAQEMKISIKDFFSKCEQICRKEWKEFKIAFAKKQIFFIC